MSSKHFVALFLVTVLGANAEARTWRITADGSGDAPFLEAVMDSAVAGDTVLVAPGEYVIGPVPLANGIVLRSEQGPLSTRLRGYPGASGGLACSQLDAPTEINGFSFEGFEANGFTGGGVVSVVDCFHVSVRGCVFTNNTKPGVSINSSGSTQLLNNTFANNEYAIYAVNSQGLCSHNVFWDRLQGLGIFMLAICNDVLVLADIPANTQAANFSLDPQFCASEDLRLSPTSPCAPGNSPRGENCGLVGALPLGCSTTKTEQHSWGSIKALYKN